MQKSRSFLDNIIDEDSSDSDYTTDSDSEREDDTDPCR